MRLPWYPFAATSVLGYESLFLLFLKSNDMKLADK